MISSRRVCKPHPPKTTSLPRAFSQEAAYAPVQSSLPGVRTPISAAFGVGVSVPMAEITFS